MPLLRPIAAPPRRDACEANGKQDSGSGLGNNGELDAASDSSHRNEAIALLIE